MSCLRTPFLRQSFYSFVTVTKNYRGSFVEHKACTWTTRAHMCALHEAQGFYMAHRQSPISLFSVQTAQGWVLACLCFTAYFSLQRAGRVGTGGQKDVGSARLDVYSLLSTTLGS